MAGEFNIPPDVAKPINLIAQGILDGIREHYPAITQAEEKRLLPDIFSIAMILRSVNERAK